jgi:hypothetical protein
MSAQHTTIPFKDAAAYVLPFGMFKGQTVDQVGTSDRGLAWLDWARGALRLDYHTRNAVCSYLDDPTIAKDLAELIARKERSP